MAVPDLKKQITGKRSKASGEMFERWLSHACEFYLLKGLAHIEKTPEPFHITGKDSSGTVRGFYEKKGQPDYKGILCDGTGIMFEAKHTDSDRISQSVVTDTQWRSLDVYERFGAHCFVMVGCIGSGWSAKERLKKAIEQYLPTVKRQKLDHE